VKTLLWSVVALIGLAVLGFGLDLSEELSSWVAVIWRPGTMGLALSTVVGMATWAATRPLPAKAYQIPISDREDRVRQELAHSERLTRGAVEGAERRQFHVRQHLEIGVARQLAGALFLIGQLEERLADQDRPEASQVAKLRGLVDRTIAEARMLADAAYPPEIETEGLEAALRKMAGAAESYQVYCRIVAESPLLQPEVANTSLQLYRVVQLIVERAIRHGKAHHILVELHAQPEKHLAMTVTDRVGFGDSLQPLTEAETLDLQARVRSVGGTLEIDRPAGGLQLICRMVAKGPKRQG
jgi:signal transduction histidine kinase